MLIYTINEGKDDERVVHCPVSWEETTLEVFQRLVSACKEGDDIIKIFSVLTGTSYAQLWEEDNEVLEAEIYRAVAFVFNQAQVFRVKPTPESFRIAGKTIPLPKKLHKMTFGQNLIIRSRLIQAQKANEPLESLISFALAIYLQPLVDADKFDLDRAKELEAEILPMNIFDTFPAGFFLLSKLNNSGASGLLGWLHGKIRRVKNMMRLPNRLTSPALSRSMILALSILTAPALASFPAMSSTSHSMKSCPSFCFGKSRANTESDSDHFKKL